MSMGGPDDSGSTGNAAVATAVTGPAPHATLPVRPAAALTVQQPPNAAPEKPGFRDGIGCFFRGIGWLATSPGAWPLAMVPLLLASLLGVVLAGLSIEFVPDLVGRFVDIGSGSLAGFGLAVLKVVATALAILVGLLLGLALAQPLSGPALEALVRKREKDLGLPVHPATHFLRDILNSLKSLLVSYAFGLPALVILFALSLVLPFASIITVPLKLMVAALMIAWDVCDYPLSLRGMPVSRRFRGLRRHVRAVLGFSIGMALAALVPCGLFLLLPAGVAGATQLVSRLEEYELSQGCHIDGTPLTD